MRGGLVLLGWGVFALSALAIILSEAVGRSEETVQPLPAVMLPESLRNFDPLALKLTWANRRWQIVQNNEVLKDFGGSEQDAQAALRLIQALGLNQLGTIGSPAVMEYWLVNGKAPRMPTHTDLRLIPLNNSHLRIDQLQGQWYLRDDQHLLFAFGANANEARQARSIIRKYDFSLVGLLGQGTLPHMYVFFGRQPGPTFVSSPPSSKILSADESSELFSGGERRQKRIEAGSEEHNGFEGYVAPVVPPLVTPQSVAPPGALRLSLILADGA